MNLLRIAPHLSATKIHTATAQAQAEAVALSGRRQWLQIRVAGKKSGGFDKEDSPDRLLGPLLGTFAPFIPSTAAGDFGGVKESTEWEIGLTVRVDVPNNSRIASPHFAEGWVKETTVLMGTRITSRVSQLGTLPLFQCVKGGVTGANQPDWPLQKSATVNDGSAIWMLVDYVTFYEVIGLNTGETHTAQTILRARELG